MCPYNTVYDIHTADGEFDAVEVDEELISARLRQDMLEQSGNDHLFIADTVSRVHFIIFNGCPGTHAFSV